MLNICLADALIPLFMPAELYQKSREWSRLVAKKANNNTRAIMKGLNFKNKKGEFKLQFIEGSRRPQVENNTLAVLLKGMKNKGGNRGIKPKLGKSVSRVLSVRFLNKCISTLESEIPMRMQFDFGIQDS